MIYPLQLRRVQASAAIKEALFTATHKLCYLKTIGHIQLSLSNSVLSSLFLTQGMHWFRCSKRKHRQVCCNMKVGVESNNILTNMTYIQECATCQIKNTSDIVYKKHVTLKPPKKKEKRSWRGLNSKLPSPVCNTEVFPSLIQLATGWLFHLLSRNIRFY